MPLWLTIVFEFTKVAIGVAALFSVHIAYKAYNANLLKQDEDRVRDSDKELLSQSEKSLQWAYEVLTDDGKNIPPVPNRLNWLTSARHIRRHNELSSKIINETYRIVHAEIEEFWRHKFYLALADASLMKSSYFGSIDSYISERQIHTISALVVLNFSRWKKGVADPIDGIDKVDIVGNGDVFRSGAGRGLQDYMRALEMKRSALLTPTTVIETERSKNFDHDAQ